MQFESFINFSVFNKNAIYTGKTLKFRYFEQQIFISDLKLFEVI